MDSSKIVAKLQDGTTTLISKENLNEYLGDTVTNYKDTSTNEIVTVGSNNYLVSTNYRLYYIDFDNKYGDGKGTIYLKADYVSTNNKYVLQTNGNMETSKIRNFNPSLFANGVTSPNLNNKGMKKAAWLLDPTKWEDLLESSRNTELGQYINYVVGAPSIELLMDSYNSHYGLTGDTPNYSLNTTATSARTKLFYKYDLTNGYLVGPNYQKKKDYFEYTSKYSLKSDPECDPLYYPPSIGGNPCSYYIASPTCKSKDHIMRVLDNDGGFISYCNKDNTENVFCPIVSVSSDCPLSLIEN